MTPGQRRWQARLSAAGREALRLVDEHLPGTAPELVVFAVEIAVEAGNVADAVASLRSILRNVERRLRSGDEGLIRDVLTEARADPMAEWLIAAMLRRHGLAV